MKVMYQWSCPKCSKSYQVVNPLSINNHNYLCPQCYNEWNQNKSTAVYECAPVSKSLNERLMLID